MAELTRTTSVARVAGALFAIGCLSLMTPSHASTQGPAQPGGQDLTVSSPSGRLRFTLEPPDGGSAPGYHIDLVADAGPIRIVESSPLGIRREDQDFTSGLRLERATEAATVDETYTVPHGPRRERRHHATARTFDFANASGARLQLLVRVTDAGVAFRYRFPETDGTARTLVAETTGFRIPAGSTAWISPYQAAGQYGPAYEDPYMQTASGATAPTAVGWAFPALFRIAEGRAWLLVTEAAVGSDDAGTHLEAEAKDGLYRVRLPEPGEGLGTGEAMPRSPLPWELPWRVFIIGSSPATIVESTLVADLNPPSRIADVSWIRPGRASWSWWSDDPSPKDPAKLKAFIDLAADMGWEYSLVDANWNFMSDEQLQDVLKHARTRGVGLLFWYNSGGPHNKVTEQPRDRMFDPEIRRRELARLREWGVRGVKVDFWQSDKQAIMALYHDIMRDAAEHRILVNFHGCTLPRGWERTWPNLMTMEAVPGAEQYKFNEKWSEQAPWLNTILPFTRNVVGPMDYTPVSFTNAKFPRRTSDGHELALSVVFESGIIHFADSVEAFRALPPFAQDFLKRVPAAWDETRLLSGEPGTHVLIARRHGREWYVGGISGQDTPVTLSFTASQIGGGRWRAHIVEDGGAAKPGAQKGAVRLGSRTFELAGASPLEVKLPARGGFVARLEPAAP